MRTTYVGWTVAALLALACGGRLWERQQTRALLDGWELPQLLDHVEQQQEACEHEREAAWDAHHAHHAGDETAPQPRRACTASRPPGPPAARQATRRPPPAQHRRREPGTAFNP